MSDPKDTIVLADEHGNPTPVPVALEQAYRERGFTDYTTAQRVNDAFKEQVASQTSTADVVGRNVLSGATLGLSDVAQRALGGESARIQMENEDAAHPTAAMLSNLAGGLAIAGGVGRLGAAVEGLAGGGILGATASGVAEGAVYGAGQGVHELALSSDPLTAEHIASTLSSNMLLGGGIGGVAGGVFKTVERGLTKASSALAEAQAARGAIEGIAPELQGLDEAGLKKAAKAAADEHAEAKVAERESLEAGRVQDRAELADQIKNVHESLATERPIFDSLASTDRDALNPALKDIEGVSDARVQLAKSYKTMRAGFDSPISVARDPSSMIRPLEMRQAALETLQAKMPEIQAALVGDARAATLEHVDGALAQTKAQLEQIRAVSKSAPLASDRLTMLEAGPSAKMQAIDAARDALKKGPELGLVGKAAKAGAFAGGTALAHMIPGVGLAAPFVGKAAADAIATLFERTSGAIGKVAGKATAAAQKFVTATKVLEPYLAPTATKVLGDVRFGAESKAAGNELHELFRARTNELYQQTMIAPDGTTVMRPEARAAMAAKLDPYRMVNPPLADKIETAQARKVAYLASIAPKKPDPPALQIGPDTSRPPDLLIRKWARAVRAAEDPESVEQRLARGVCTPEEAASYSTCHPERFAALQREIFNETPKLAKTLPMSKKVALSVFTGIPVTRAMQPNVISVLQQTFDVEPGSAGGTQAPRAQPSFSSMGSLKDMDKPTPSQERHQ